MTVFFYFILFAIGVVIGSFCTLAVYRIPLKKDITHERSFCPNCGHKLSFFDLIPILSYIFLKGKCRYCKNHIRIRYIILEIVAGFVMLALGFSINISPKNIDINILIYLFFNILYITGIIIIAGIDKENKKIETSVLVYNIIVSTIYILYLFIVGSFNMNRYGIYLFFMLSLIGIKLYELKSKKQRKYSIVYYVSLINVIIILLQNLYF